MDMTSSTRQKRQSGVFPGRVRNHQLASSFFGRLPAEIRQLIYAECWAASGSRQHVFHRRPRQDRGQDTTSATTDPRQRQCESGEPRLTHFPCCKSEDDDEELLAEYDYLMERNRLPGSRGKAAVVDAAWSNRFASPWMDHWRCEEAMNDEWEMRDFEASAGVARSRRSRGTRTAFLGVLLCCKRMYQEALPSLYAATTFIYTDLATAHHTLVSLPSPTTSLLRSVRFSLAVPYDILHQHRYYSSPGVYAGPWAELCVKLSNMVRFDGLRDVVMRLDLADRDGADALDLAPVTRATSGRDAVREGAGSSSRPLSRRLSNAATSGDGEHRMWWQVRERWILSAVRGMLARRLTVQLPERRRRRTNSSSSGPPTPLTSTSHTRPGATSGKAPASPTSPVREHDADDGPEWMRPYQYFEGDETPFKLERYRTCRPSSWSGMRVSSGGERSSWAVAGRGSVSSGSGSGARSGPPSPRTLLGFVSGTLNGPGNPAAAEGMNGSGKGEQTVSRQNSVRVASEAMGSAQEGEKFQRCGRASKVLSAGTGLEMPVRSLVCASRELQS